MTELESYRAKVERWYTHGTAHGVWGLLPWWTWVSITVVAGFLIVSWFNGRRRGSHAGREGIRRAYRRELARQMARQDARKIERDETPGETKARRKWMQW
jgi:hypothetical protein